MDEEIENKLEKIAERAEKNKSWAVEQYQEKLEMFQSRKKDDVPDGQLPRLAVASLNADINETNRTSGETEEIPILSLGNSGVRPMGGSDVLVAAGIINPTEDRLTDNDGEDEAGVAVILCDEAEGADLGRMKEAFQPLKTLEGHFSRRLAPELEKKGKGPVYLLETTPHTEAEEADLDGLPGTRDEKRKLINELYIDEGEKFTLSDFEEHITATSDDGYPVSYGADIKRFQGHVVDVRRDDEKDYGLYVVVDDTVADTKELEDTDLDTGQRGQKIGLRVWTNPEQAKYGKNSVIEAYGVLEPNRDGDVQMNAFGVVPIVEFSMEEGDASSSKDKEDVKTETI